MLNPYKFKKNILSAIDFWHLLVLTCCHLGAACMRWGCTSSCQYQERCKGCLTHPKRMNFRKSSKRPLTPPLIFGKSCCRFFIKLYSLKNHTCGIFLKSPGYESIKNNDPCCQIQSLNFKFWGWLGPRLLVHWGKVRGSHRSGTGSHMETHRTEHVYISPVCCSRHQQKGTVLWDAGAPA